MFTATAQDGLARCGLMMIRNTSISTPTPMIYTRRGGCMFLTPDMLEKLRPEGQMLQVNTTQFLQLPSPEILQQYGKSIHNYLGTPSWAVFASNRDPTLLEYISSKPSNNTAAYLTIYTGGTYVTPERYMQAIAAMQPDFFVSLADEVPGDAKPKRVKQSVDRTIMWLDECIQRHQEQQQQQPQGPADGTSVGDSPIVSTSNSSISSAAHQVFAPVVGGGIQEERTRSAQAAAERDVAGFALCGFGMGERASLRPALLESALRHLPANKPKLAAGLDCPEDVLDAVAVGVDLFDCSYPTQATANGYALSFPVREDVKQQQSSDLDVGSGADDSKINMWATQYRLDKGPLVAGCSCFTCKNHSRAYIHHLLQTHEMLAGVLLEMHNTHWWLQFFAAIQEAIQQERLQQYIKWFKQRRELVQLQQAQQ